MNSSNFVYIIELRHRTTQSHTRQHDFIRRNDMISMRRHDHVDTRRHDVSCCHSSKNSARENTETRCRITKVIWLVDFFAGFWYQPMRGSLTNTLFQWENIEKKLHKSARSTVSCKHYKDGMRWRHDMTCRSVFIISLFRLSDLTLSLTLCYSWRLGQGSDV